MNNSVNTIGIHGLFGYSLKKDYHSPLERIFVFIDFRSLSKNIFLVCKDFYLASVSSFKQQKFNFFDKKFYKHQQLWRFSSRRYPTTSFMKFIKTMYEMDVFCDEKSINDLFEFCCRYRDEKYESDTTDDIIRLLVDDERFDLSIERNIKAIGLMCNRDTDLLMLLQTDKRVDLKVFGNDELNSMLEERADRGDFKTVKFILSSKHFKLIHDNKAVCKACHFRWNYKMVALLLNDPRCKPRDFDLKGAICNAIGNRCIESLDLILELPTLDKPSIEKLNEEFISACQYGTPELVETLLHDKRIKPGMNKNDAFISACQKDDNIEIIKLLLKSKNVNPCARDNYAIKEARYHGRKNVVELLLQDKRVRSKNTKYSEKKNRRDAERRNGIL